MAYTIADTVFDQALNYLKNNVTKIVVLTADPAGSFSDADTAFGTGDGKKLAEVTVDSTDFTLADGATDGRKVTCQSQNDLDIDVAGDATHIAWLNVSGTAVLFVTELTTPRTGLTVSDTVDIPAHFAAIRDAVVAS